jgi:hypothetical protein
MNIVQARCPFCKNMLRIPADWLERPMRCKHCKNIFQAKDRAPQPAIAESGGFPMGPMTAPEPAAAGFGLDNHQPAYYPPMPAPSYAPPGYPPAPYPPAPYPPQPYAAAPYPPPYPPQSYGAPPGYAPPPPVPGGFDNIDAGSQDGGDAMVAKPRARRAGKNNGALIGWLVVGGLFLVTVAVMGAVLPGVLRSVNEEHPAHVKIDPKKQRQIDAIKKSIEDIKNGKAGPPPSVVNTKSPAFGSTSVMPRRALIISPENYLLLNRTQFFQEDNGMGQFENTLVRRFSAGAPLDISPGQIYTLSDSDILQTAMPPQKSVVEAAIKEFCEGSRAQDRIMLLWSGHAAEIDGKTYLIPVEGDKDTKETCIPLAWVYEQLGKSKARQKVLIFDAFRFPPARGLELPATGAMTEAVDKELDNPPAGIQVWTACLKDQQSIEFESGSVFQLAMREALKEMSVGTIVKASDPLPLEPLVAKVNQIMKLKLGKEKSDEMAKDGKEMKKDDTPELTQTSRLSGKELPGAEPSGAEPLPKAVVFADPDKGGAQFKAIDDILREIKEFKPMKQAMVAQLFSLRATALPLLPKEKLDEYPDQGFNPFSGKTDKDSLKKAQEKYPFRVAAFEAASKVNETMELRMKEYIPNPGGGAFDQNRKKQFLAEQKEPAIAILDLEETYADMKKLDEDREKETNKRWLAHFDMAKARLLSRLVYIYEYDNLIAQIRTDSLPALEEKIHVGWRVNTSNKVQIKEAKVKAMVKEVSKIWTRMEKDYPMTPWAIIAKREKNIAMGMTWVPTRE